VLDGLPLSLDELMRQSPAGMCVFDVEGRYLWVSQLVASINGLTPEEHVGKTIADVVPYLADSHTAIVARVAQRDEPETVMSTSTIPGESSPRSAAEHFYPLHDDDGRVVAVANVFWETTDVVEAATRAGQDLEAERAAREAAQLAQSRLEFVARAARSLTGSLEVRDVLAALVNLAVPEVADWATAYLHRDGMLERAAAAYREPDGTVVHESPPDLPSLRADGDSPAAEAFRTSAIQIVSTGDPDRLRANAPEGLYEVFRRLRIHSGLAVPLLGGDEQPLGVLAFAVGEGRSAPGAFDVAAATELAARAGVALDHALTFDRERVVADALRRTILPDDVPTVDGVELAARLVPAARWARVGGDWYDAIVTSGRLVVAVGDVAGHGVTAASTMAEARHAFRAYAVEGCPPHEIASKVTRLFSAGEAEVFVTATIVALDPSDGSFEFVNAGHPPPLVIATDACTYLEGVDPPLGVTRSSYRAGQRGALTPGATMLLYTDGLVERRGVALDDRLRAFASSCRELVRDPVEVLVDRLTTVAASDDPEDDVCLLALRYSP
jgi:PAS domain S-box-containing protein